MAPLRPLGAKMPVGQKPPANRESSMNEITTIGLDLAKHVFQVHGVDAAGATVLRKQLRRAAWLGLVPRQNSTGGKNRLGGISKRGNQYLRRLLINGASANLLRSKATNADPRVIGLRRRRPSLVVAVALANKTARIAWAVMHRQENYKRMVTAA
jgi:transposase